MCLTKKSMIPRIALKDIVVYKILINDSKGNLFTPIVCDNVKLGYTYKGMFGISNNELRNPRNLISSLFSKYITSGYIHSHTDEFYAACRYTGHLVKCIIPKGTLYFIGNDLDIASRKLKYVEIIK